MENSDKLSQREWLSLIATLAIGSLLGVLAWASARNDWLLWLAASVGGLGGLVHEIAQSGGKIAFFRKYEDGMYLGSIAGAVLGAVAGILVIRGHITAAATAISLDFSKTQITYEVFLAGLALKGITEAAGGNAVPAGKKGG